MANSLFKTRVFRSPRFCGTAAWLVALLVTAPAALAHDTWFAVRGSSLPGNTVVALGTGNVVPLQEYAVGPEYLVAHGCRQAGRELPLTAVATASTALVLRVAVPAAAGLTCWAQLTPFDIELAADKIGLYLDEINASDAVRARWAGIQARGLPWKERYVKSARLEIAAPAGAKADGAAGAQARPAPLGMDVQLQGGAARLRSGEPLAFQVLRDGQPLADQAIELRGSDAAQARWLRTDAQGQVHTTAPAAGAWVLRGVDLRPSGDDAWASRFVTLSFQVY